MKILKDTHNDVGPPYVGPNIFIILWIWSLI